MSGGGAPGRVLVVNAGSSSLKLSVLDESEEVVEKHEIDHWDDGDASVLDDVAGGWEFDAVGHRVVHGGGEFTEATVVDDEVRARIERLTSLAPLHQPRALAGIDAAREAFGDRPSVACFDTGFHASLSPAASTYAVPAAWRDRWPLRRFGYHGLSHAYAARRTADLLERPVEGFRVVTCHLGAGASLCAVSDGRSVDTTMGFTPSRDWSWRPAPARSTRVGAVAAARGRSRGRRGERRPGARLRDEGAGRDVGPGPAAPASG